MKKVLKTLLVLLMGVFFLTGCAMKENIGVEISKDGDVTLKLMVLMDNEMIDTYLTISEMSEAEQAAITDPSQIEVKEHTDAERWAFFESDDMKDELEAPEGFKTEKYEKDGFKGYVFTKDVGTLEEIVKDAPASRVSISDIEDDAKGMFIKDGDNYKSNLKITSEAAFDEDDMSQITEYGGVFEMQLVIEIPTKAISNNADKVENDGKTLMWDLTKAKDIELEFTLKGAAEEDEKEESEGTADKKKSKDEDDEKSKLPLYIGIGCGGGLLLLVIVIAIVASSKKKKAQNAAAAMNQQQMVMAPNYAEPPVQPIQPVAQPAPVEPAPAPVAPAEPVQQPVDPNQPQQ
ncbi:MAG: hypothetical protein II625_00495 [Bacilli bacterium]|nr:hypothetical protein [Bacilli bacterium]